MKCPRCTSMPSEVLKTERPLDEGLEYGDVKRRLRKCRQCSNNFTTFEVQESLFRLLKPKDELTESKKNANNKKLSRQPLQFGNKSNQTPNQLPKK